MAEEEVIVTVPVPDPAPVPAPAPAPTVVVVDVDAPDAAPEPVACEHTQTISDLGERVSLLEALVSREPEPEPEPVVVVEPEPEPEPIEEDEAPNREHWFHRPIGS